MIEKKMKKMKNIEPFWNQKRYYFSRFSSWKL